MEVQRLIVKNRLYAMVVVLAGLLIAASAGAAPNRATAPLVTPRTLVIEHGKIHLFAQDGNFIAWIGGRHYTIHLRGVTKRTGWILGSAAPGGAVGSQGPSDLVLGGTRAVWVNYGGVMTREAAIRTAKPGQRRPTIVDTPGVSGTGGTHLAGLAADGEQTIVYGEATVKCDPQDECNKWSLTRGGVHRITGVNWYPPRIKGIPPAFAVAASRGRVAVVPAAVTNPLHRVPKAAPNGPVEVYNLLGRRLARVVPQGTVREVALSWPDLAVIVVRTDGTTAIERYHSPTGKLLATTTMPGASNLAIGEGGIIFLVEEDDLHDS